MNLDGPQQYKDNKQRHKIITLSQMCGLKNSLPSGLLHILICSYFLVYVKTFRYIKIIYKTYPLPQKHSQQ